MKWLILLICITAAAISAFVGLVAAGNGKSMPWFFSCIAIAVAFVAYGVWGVL